MPRKLDLYKLQLTGDELFDTYAAAVEERRARDFDKYLLYANQIDRHCGFPPQNWHYGVLRSEKELRKLYRRDPAQRPSGLPAARRAWAAHVLPTKEMASWEGRFRDDPRYWELCYWVESNRWRAESGKAWPKYSVQRFAPIAQAMNRGILSRNLLFNLIGWWSEAQAQGPRAMQQASAVWDELQLSPQNLHSSLTPPYPEAAEDLRWLAGQAARRGDHEKMLVFAQRANKAQRSSEQWIFPLGFSKMLAASGKAPGSLPLFWAMDSDFFFELRHGFLVGTYDFARRADQPECMRALGELLRFLLRSMIDEPLSLAKVDIELLNVFVISKLAETRLKESGARQAAEVFGGYKRRCDSVRSRWHKSLNLGSIYPPPHGARPEAGVDESAELWAEELRSYFRRHVKAARLMREKVLPFAEELLEFDFEGLLA